MGTYRNFVCMQEKGLSKTEMVDKYYFIFLFDGIRYYYKVIKFNLSIRQ